MTTPAKAMKTNYDGFKTKDNKEPNMALAMCKICGADFQIPWQGSVTPNDGICGVCEEDEELMEWYRKEKAKESQLAIDRAIDADREHQTHGI